MRVLNNMLKCWQGLEAVYELKEPLVKWTRRSKQFADKKRIFQVEKNPKDVKYRIIFC